MLCTISLLLIACSSDSKEELPHYTLPETRYTFSLSYNNHNLLFYVKNNNWSRIYESCVSVGIAPGDEIKVYGNEPNLGGDPITVYFKDNDTKEYRYETLPFSTDSLSGTINPYKVCSDSYQTIDMANLKSLLLSNNQATITWETFN